MKLALGTVQFGLPYGIANQTGQTSLPEARSIIDYAGKSGIDTLDTAAAYGESEQRLGEVGVQGWKIISKLPGMPEEVSEVEAWVRQRVESSLRLLRVPRLAGLLLHRPADLLSARGPALERTLVALKAEGVVEKIGVSVYDPAALEQLVGRFRVDLVQAPLSVLDRRLFTSGWMERLHGLGIELHVRSVFLQGLLLLSRQSRPRQFDRWSGIWQRWEEYLLASHQTPLQACLRFACTDPRISRVVVGTESQRQLEEIVSALQHPGKPVPDHLQSEDPLLVDPSRWNQLGAH